MNKEIEETTPSEDNSQSVNPFTDHGLPDAEIKEDSALGLKSSTFPIVGVGASAGGVDALQRLFKSLPSDHSIAYVVVVHLSPKFPSQLADILAKSTSLSVVQVTSDIAIETNTIYIISPNNFLTLSDGLLRIQQIPQPRPLLKSIDHLFVSLAAELQEKSICIVLTGGDHDGTIGLKAIKAAGGMAMAQLPETAQHPDMPKSAIHTGLVDYVLPIEQMGEKLIHYIDQTGFWRFETPLAPEKESQKMGHILNLIGTHGGGDFRGYKPGMLMRRTKRRMALHGLSELDGYLEYLKKNPNEVLALGADFLIKVTEFFREPAAWQALQQLVLPKIIENIAPGRPLRIWVAGCATGEEAYSMAITMLEFLSIRKVNIKLNIIGSDLDLRSLKVARSGSYPESIKTVLKPELLARYFVRESDGRFKVRKLLRESVMFSHHNFLVDPPFSQMDLISCRNLLIYIQPEIQDKILRMFHFALNPAGYLFLGKSETIGEHHELFVPMNKQHRIYRNVPTERKIPLKLPLVVDAMTTRLQNQPTERTVRVEHAELVRELLLRQRSATAVLIDGDNQILYFYGHTQNLMWQPEGATTRNLLSMVSDEMRIALRAVIHSVRNEDKKGEIILPGASGENKQLRIRGIKAGDESAGLVLITFEYETLREEPNQAIADADSWAKRQLEDDLRTTRIDLETSIQSLETSNVELRIANEEAMSLNEEFQSANEELETSKEELQSVNEELNTVNIDMERTVNELRTANDDLSNLLAGSDLPTLFLDQDFRIKRFTPASSRLFSLLPTDIGRPIGDFSMRMEQQDLIAVAKKVQNSHSVIEDEVYTADGHYFLRRILPYRIEDRVEGVVVTFIPIDALKRAEEELRVSEKQFRVLADTAPVLIWISGINAQMEFVNRRFIDLTGKKIAEILGIGWHNIIHPDDLSAYLAACSCAESAKIGYEYELRLHKADGTYHWMQFVGEPRFENEKLLGFIGSTVDIQYHRDAEEQLRHADRRKDEFLAILGHELRNPLSPIRNAAEVLQHIDSKDKNLSWATDIIIRQVEHMTRLVEDLLDISRLTQGKLALQKESVDMALIVHQTLQSIKGLIDERNHELTVEIKDEPLFVNGDPIRLTQILENLLSNAIKFTENGGKIFLNAHREGDELVLSVIDSGIGISQKKLSSIFELFMQEERAIKKSSSGLGVGLSLVSQLVSLHGGTITASSKGEGQGSQFVLHLPLIDITPNTQLKDTSCESGTESILIVDDNKDVADSLALMMTAYGYKVRIAYDYESALREVALCVPDFALLDLSIPEPNGLKLARRFKQMTKKINLIAFSGYGHSEDIELSKKAGFSHYLVKPSSFMEIHKLIRSIKN
ncbi:CheR family methyltransferase [Nitrosomonas supralitoralis]|uniref:histidine kinase n=1 Tax=Nitrosomonas supralitoralis TaxID=2116706 RepID=A0A2P7NRM8_9PROT|nr:CheR family methyltransferase [Nitrosomonas supralitoralis]PSJ16120.1 hypothetical protein C7H79_15205 [Nitrosomonas supralitoralis]